LNFKEIQVRYSLQTCEFWTVQKPNLCLVEFKCLKI
jgi:hypothetical protein